jgi:TolA-binding protein
MNPKVKLSAYAVLLILCGWFAVGFYSNYSAVTKPAPDTGAEEAATASENSTNAMTNHPAGANAAATGDTNAAATMDTNAAATAETNAPPSQTNVPAKTSPAVSRPAPASDESSRRSVMIVYLAALVGVVIGLGLLITHDVTQFMGGQVVDFLFDDLGEGERDPEYDRAEAEWANGKYLEAIQIMRDFLKKNPRGLYAALRIAEIYEKDLKNNLAAALEYEEILKHKLPANKWAWTAIHLCNLYSRLNQSDKALALLHRVADEYPRTSAAKKARAHLGIAEPAFEAAEEETEAEPESMEEGPAISMEEHPPELEPRGPSQTPPPPPEPSEPPKPSLPPGFRPKE